MQEPLGAEGPPLVEPEAHLDVGAEILAEPRHAEGARAGHGEDVARLRGQSFFWGPFRFTKKRAGWEAWCPYHKRNRQTDCKKYLTANNRGEAVAIRALKSWCLCAPRHNRQWKHLAVPVDAVVVEEEAFLDAQLATLPEVANVRPDTELDALEAPRQAARSRAKAKPGAKAKAKACASGSAPAADDVASD